MGRPKKIQTENTNVEQEVALKDPFFSAESPRDTETFNVDSIKSVVRIRPIFERDRHGLLDHVEYTFKQNGFVDWRKMISAEHIVLNRENFLKKENPIDLDTLTEEEVDKLKSKASEKDILIKLSGYKELAQLRGFKELLTKVEYFTESNLAKAECIIKWLPNYETDGLDVTSNGNADACPENTNGFSSKYLTAIAENRAIIRAIRGFLQIQVVGQDEVKSETPEDFRESGPVLLLSGPQGTIAKKLKDNKRTLAELVQFAMSKYQYSISNAESWNKVQDISPADATFLLDKFEEFLKRE